MSRKQQSYQNRGFKKLLLTMFSYMSSAYNNLFHRRINNEGKAGAHLVSGYQPQKGHYRNTKKQQSKSKAAIEKKRRRKEIQKSQRINRKRKAGVCSFK